MMDNYYQDSRCLDLEKALADESVTPVDLPFLFLKAITQDFSDNQCIGSGGFGSVYKGELRNGMVAVKKLHNRIEVKEKDFQREVACLEEVKHKNIVRFLGYCYETQHIRKQYQGKYVWADELHMLFCFEFLGKGSLAKYVTDASSGLEWRVRYQIIKGICDGMAHLHERRFVHMDLKPENILLDNTMVPKIADFGISRRFSEDQSKVITENIIGSRGYMPPEFLRSGTITLGTDIYSLGVIIIEILTGSKEFPNVNKVLESWTNAFGTSKSNPPLEQIKLCAEIGIDCMHDDPSKRPDIQDIIRRLNETDISLQLGRFYQYYRQAKQACRPIRILASMTLEPSPCSLSESALLDVYPLELCFPFEAKKVAQCSLSIINRTDRHFAYFIRPQFQDMYTINQPVLYTLDPRSTIVLNVKMAEQEMPPLDAGIFEILMISMENMRDLQNLESSFGKDPQKIDNLDLLKRVEELDGEVHAAMLKAAVLCPARDAAPKIISRVPLERDMLSIDVHPTQPWILVGQGKLLSIWHYEMEATTIFSININDNARKLYRMILGHFYVTSVRFIPRKEWCVAGDSRGYIHVYWSLHTMAEIKSFRASGAGSVESLAIHPTCPYLLSGCIGDGVVEIWDWENGWACLRKVQSGDDMSCATFNPMDANTFVTSHYNDGLKVWSINNPSARQPITAIECPDFLCHGHVPSEAAGRNHVVVFNYFHKGPEIWDLQTGTRVHTLLHGFGTGANVACHPTLPLIAQCTKGAYALVHLWNSTNYRVEKTVWCIGRKIICVGFVGSRRLVIAYEGNRMEVLEIDLESLACQQ